MTRLLPAGSGEISSFENSARADSLFVNRKLGFSADRPAGLPCEWTTFLMQGFTHEVVRTKKVQLHKEKRRGGFNCINSKNDPTLANLTKNNGYCIPISVDKDDPCYGNQVKSLNYVRHFTVLDDCKLSLTPSALNMETSFMDCKLLYNNASLNHMLDNGGRVDVGNFDLMKELLVGYDERSSQFSGLFISFIKFYEYHNLIHTELLKSRSFLSLQDFLLEVRKIVCATYQILIVNLISSFLSEFLIIFNEFF